MSNCNRVVSRVVVVRVIAVVVNAVVSIMASIRVNVIAIVIVRISVITTIAVRVLITDLVIVIVKSVIVSLLLFRIIYNAYMRRYHGHRPFLAEESMGARTCHTRLMLGISHNLSKEDVAGVNLAHRFQKGSPTLPCR